MDATMLIRVVAGIFFLVVLGYLIARRKRKSA